MGRQLNRSAHEAHNIAKSVWQSLKESGKTVQEAAHIFKTEFKRAYAEERAKTSDKFSL